MGRSRDKNHHDRYLDWSSMVDLRFVQDRRGSGNNWRRKQHPKESLIVYVKSILFHRSAKQVDGVKHIGGNLGEEGRRVVRLRDLAGFDEDNA